MAFCCLCPLLRSQLQVRAAVHHVARAPSLDHKRRGCHDCYGLPQIVCVLQGQHVLALLAIGLAGDVVSLGDGRTFDGVKPFYLKPGQTVSWHAAQSASTRTSRMHSRVGSTVGRVGHWCASAGAPGAHSHACMPALRAQSNRIMIILRMPTRLRGLLHRSFRLGTIVKTVCPTFGRVENAPTACGPAG